MQPRDDHPTEPCKCPVCDMCRAYTAGPSKGRCVYGGPYLGYMKITGVPAPAIEAVTGGAVYDLSSPTGARWP